MEEAAEQIVKEVETPTHKGPYGDITGVPASGLYERYEAWYANKNDGSKKGMLVFNEWLNWAKEQGLIVKKEPAPADKPVEAPTHVAGSFEQNMYRTNRRIAGLLLTTSVLFLAVNAFKD